MKSVNDTDLRWMSHAIELASTAEKMGEVPVGAVIIRDNQLLSESYNQPISLCDPTAHAEILALRAATTRIENYRLLNTTLYVTLEPCAMCAGAIVHARVARVVFACADPKSGAAGSVFSILGSNKLNHFVEVTAGVMEEEAATLLKNFFRQRR